MYATLDDLDEFFTALNEESVRSWMVHYNELLNHSSQEWERESLEDLIRFNKCFDV